MLRKCFVWPETGSLWVRASWWSVLSNGLFLQSCPRQYLQERLGWDLAAARRMLALQPLLVCVYSDVSAWHVGTGREWLKDLSVYIVWPWAELSCRALRPVAFALLVLHLPRAWTMPLQCPDLFPAGESCFQLDSRVKKGTLVFHKGQRLCAVFADRNGNSEYKCSTQNQREAFLAEGPTQMLRMQAGTLEPQLQTWQWLFSRFHLQCHREGGQHPTPPIPKEREKCKF